MRRWRNCCAAFVAVMLLLSVGTAVLAGDFPEPVKITNPAHGVGEADGIDPDGYMGVHAGDRWNSYIWSLCCMEGCDEDTYLWAGTNRNILYQALYQALFPLLSQAGFTIRDFDYAMETLFCGNIPTGWPGCENIIYPEKDFRAQIWRKNLTDDTEWEMVHQADTCDEWWIDEEETVKYIAGMDWGYRACITYTPPVLCAENTDQVECCPYGGEAIYFGTAASLCNPAWSVWRFYDNECCDDIVAEKVFEEIPVGVGAGILDAKLSARAFAVYNDKLFVGTDNLAIYWDNFPDPVNTGQGGSPAWTQVACAEDLGFEGVVWDMVSFKGYLYVFVSTPGGFSVYRAQEPDCGDWEWECMVGPGSDRYVQGMGRACNAAATPVVCGDYVYVGTFIDIFKVIQDVLMIDSFQAELLQGLDADLNTAESGARSQAQLRGCSDEEEEQEVLQARGAVCGSRILLSILRIHEAFAQVCPAQVYRFSRDVCVDLAPATGDENGDGECVCGDTWELVVGTPGEYNPYFGEALSDWGDGFGSWFNLYVWRLVCCDGKLFMTTYDKLAFFQAMTECWFDDEGNLNHPFWSCLPQDLQDKVACLASELGAIMANASAGNPAGFDMYCLTNPDAERGASLDIQAVTQDGFGDRYNYGGRTLACCDDCLYIGTANPFYGGQIWEMCFEEEPVTPPCSGCPCCGTCPFEWIQILIGLDLEPLASLYGGSGWFFQVSCTDPVEQQDAAESGETDPVEVVFNFGDTCPVQKEVVLFRWDAAELRWTLVNDADPVWSDGPPCELTVTLTEPCGDIFAVVPADTTVDAMNGETGGGAGGDDETGGSGGGCNVGFSAAALLFAVPLVHIFRKR